MFRNRPWLIKSCNAVSEDSMPLNKFEFWLMDFENENIGKILNLKNGYTIEKEPDKLYRVKFAKTTRNGKEMYLEKNDELMKQHQSHLFFLYEKL